jgi:hypothetical protein
VLELVAVPLAVNVASSAVYDLVRRLVTGLRRGREDRPAVEVIEVTASGGDRVPVVRDMGVQLGWNLALARLRASWPTQ